MTCLLMPALAWAAGGEPRLLLPGVVCTELSERDLSFSPDGGRLFTTLWTGRAGILLESRLADGAWSTPRRLPFSGNPGPAGEHFSDLEAFMTTDGAWLWFSSNRPRPGQPPDTPVDYDLWRVAWTPAGWGEAQPLPSPPNGPGDDFYPTLAADGLLVFTSEREGGQGGEDLWFSREVSGRWVEAWNGGAVLNSDHGEFNGLLAPDGRHLWFSSSGRDPGEIGGGDLFVSARAPDGSWQGAVCLPASVNSPALDFCPALGPDGRFYFSSRRHLPPPWTTAPESRDSLATWLRAPGNGAGDIFELPEAPLP